MYSTRPGRTATYVCDMKTYRKRTFGDIHFHLWDVSLVFGCMDRYLKDTLTLMGIS
jgi:hypothetical protein